MGVLFFATQKGRPKSHPKTLGHSLPQVRGQCISKNQDHANSGQIESRIDPISTHYTLLFQISTPASPATSVFSHDRISPTRYPKRYLCNAIIPFDGHRSLQLSLNIWQLRVERLKIFGQIMVTCLSKIQGFCKPMILQQIWYHGLHRLLKVH